MMNNIVLQKSSISDMEKLINKLSGVILTKIIVDSRGEIAEVHILANYLRSPKQIVRDIQSLSATSFQMNIEHRLISIAQIADDSMLEVGIRLKIQDFEVSWLHNKVNMSVTLAGLDHVAKGTATGMNTAPSRNMTAARACIAALHDYLSIDCIFDIIDIQKLKIAGEDSYSVAISYNNNGEDQVLLGASLVRDGDYNAIICATLDAVNRIVNRILTSGTNFN